MFNYLFKREYLATTFLLFAMALLFYFRAQLSEVILTKLTNTTFHYFTEAYMPFMLLLVGFVSIGLFAALDRNQDLAKEEKAKATSSYLLLVLVFGVVSWAVHLYSIYSVLVNKTSMSALEENTLLYHISDIGIVLGFIIGGLVYLRKAIHTSTNDSSSIL